jgi:hypothetical protein
LFKVTGNDGPWWGTGGRCQANGVICVVVAGMVTTWLGELVWPGRRT